MALPKQARKQLEEAEKLYEEVYKEVEGEEDPPPEPPAEPPKLEVAAEPAPEPPAEPAPEPPAEQNWEHKYQVLQGKYDAEVPRLSEQNRALAGRLSEMEGVLANMNAPPVETPPELQIETGDLITNEELEDYGADMIDVVQRAAMQKMAPTLNALQEENAQLRGMLGGMQQSTQLSARQVMLGELDEKEPGWRATNQDQGFLTWLNDIDTFSGQRRMDLLRAAFDANNSPRVLAFFKAYTSENAATTPATPTNPTGQAPQVNLDTLVAPGRASSDAPRAPETNAKIYTESEIGAFYADVQRGRYANDPETKDKIERDIFKAQSEGRIQ